MATESESVLLRTLLLNNIELPINVEVIRDMQNEWGKSLEKLPLFSIKDIETYRLKTGKRKAILKTKDRGLRFMKERYISFDSIFTRTSKICIYIKGKCKASMKQATRTMNVSLNIKSGSVIKGFCDCPAGKSGYCNHIMALLFELAEYSLHQLKTVPTELSCTSKPRQKYPIERSKD